MATRTSNGTGGGNASSTSTWSGSTVPVTGDIVVIASGDTVNWDTGLTTAGAGILLGSKASGIGHAMQINGTDSSTYGKLIVDSGATLWLRGFDDTSSMGYVQRYARFEPAAGSTIVGDIAGDCTSFIYNYGMITAVGNSGSKITFTSPSSNYSWSNQITGETFPVDGAGQWPWDFPHNIGCVGLSKTNIANAAGTGIGSLGDSSLSFASQSPGTILATEVATLADVNGTGKYYVNYHVGAVFFYFVYSGNPSATATYKYLTLTKGWGIVSDRNTSHNKAVYDYCIFEYMGPLSTGSIWALQNDNKLTAGANSAATDRLFQFTNNISRYNNRFLEFSNVTGTSGDPILITNNTFNQVGTDDVYGSSISVFRPATADYIKIDSNIINTRFQFLALTSQYAGTCTYNGLLITNNTGFTSRFIAGSIVVATMPDGIISGNIIYGFGTILDTRCIMDLNGTSGHPLVITNNQLWHMSRGLHLGLYLTITKNQFIYCFHHVIVGSVNDEIWSGDIEISNNLFFGAYEGFYGSASVGLGYNHNQHIDNVRVFNNTTSDNNKGFIDFGDTQDGGPSSIISGIVVRNNLARMTTTDGTAIQRMPTNSTGLNRISGLSFDYNLDYNFTTRYASGAPKQGTFSGITNCTGVSLFNPSYASGISGKTLTLTVTSLDSNVTIGWDGGTAQQLIFSTNGTGSLTASAHDSYNGLSGVLNSTVTNGSASWSTTLDNAACPVGHWLKITSGAGSWAK